MKRIITVLLAAAVLLAFGCTPKTETKEEPKPAIADGTYTVALTLEGGTGKAKLASPAEVTVQDGRIAVKLVWSSDKYDYMIVGGEKLLPEYADGHSVFTVAVGSLEKPLPVTADTVAMSTPHEIEYTVTFDAASLAPAS